MYNVKDINLAEVGRKRVDWARKKMPVLTLIKEEFEKDKPLDGIRVGACLHVTVETANLMEVLVAGGAEIALAASNPLSTQDDVAAYLAKEGISVFAERGVSDKEYYENLNRVLDIRPNLTMDDGADAIAIIHDKRQDLLSDVIGGTEETTTGVIRLQALADQGKLKYPVIAVNDAETKMMFDNRYGTGQSTLHGILNVTNFMFAGGNVVVVGYGWCGRGVAKNAKGLGSTVIVVEVEPRKALEARMDGFEVMPMDEAAELGDLFISVTGNISVIRKRHFARMKDGAIVANSGHFNVEINIEDLKGMAVEVTDAAEDVIGYTLDSGNTIFVLAEGRLVNLSCAFGHPPDVMDMSFANQALCSRYVVENHQDMSKSVLKVPVDIDRRVAKLKLDSMGIAIEKLTEEQKRYLSSWDFGT